MIYISDWRTRPYSLLFHFSACSLFFFFFFCFCICWSSFCDHIILLNHSIYINGQQQLINRFRQEYAVSCYGKHSWSLVKWCWNSGSSFMILFAILWALYHFNLSPSITKQIKKEVIITSRTAVQSIEVKEKFVYRVSQKYVHVTGHWLCSNI